MNYRQTLGLLTLATLLSGCGTSPPRSPEDMRLALVIVDQIKAALHALIDGLKLPGAKD